MFFVRSRSNWNLEMSVINLNLQDRKEKPFYTQGSIAECYQFINLGVLSRDLCYKSRDKGESGRSRGARDFKL